MTWYNPLSWGRAQDIPQSRALTPFTMGAVAKTTETRQRDTRPSNNIFAGLGISFIPRRAYHRIDIDKFDATRYNAQQILDVLADVSGEVGIALWNVLRLGAVNWTFEVRNLSGKRVLTRAQKRLNDFYDYEVNQQYGGFPVLVRQLFQTSFLQGAHACELELTTDQRNVVDIHAVQPWSIKFQRDAQMKYRMYQEVPGQHEPIELNTNLVWYIPMDPAVDDPYGRAPAAPVIWPLTFDLQFLRDLKQAIHVAGWGRLDVSIIQEVALANAPPDVKQDSSKLKDWLNTITNDVKTAFESLRSDDTFIHTDAVQVKVVDPKAAMTTAAPLTRLLEIRLTRALKQLPVLMGGSVEGTETQGTVQYEIYTNGLGAMRDIVGFTLARVSETILRVWGIQGRVTVLWPSIRTKDRLREAQAEQLEIINEVWKRDQGWNDNDEAGEAVTGKPKAEGEPLILSAPSPVQDMPNAIPAHRAATDPSPTDGDSGRPVEGDTVASSRNGT